MRKIGTLNVFSLERKKKNEFILLVLSSSFEITHSRHIRVCILTGHSSDASIPGRSPIPIQSIYTIHVQYTTCRRKRVCETKGNSVTPLWKKWRETSRATCMRARMLHHPSLVRRGASRPARNTTPFYPLIHAHCESDCTSDEPPGARSHDKCAMGIFTRESLIPPWESSLHTHTHTRRSKHDYARCTYICIYIRYD